MFDGNTNLLNLQNVWLTVLSGNASQPETATLALWCEFWEEFGSVYPTHGSVLEIKCFRNLLKMLKICYSVR